MPLDKSDKGRKLIYQFICSEAWSRTPCYHLVTISIIFGYNPQLFSGSKLQWVLGRAHLFLQLHVCADLFNNGVCVLLCFVHVDLTNKPDLYMSYILQISIEYSVSKQWKH